MDYCVIYYKYCKGPSRTRFNNSGLSPDFSHSTDGEQAEQHGPIQMFGFQHTCKLDDWISQKGAFQIHNGPQVDLLQTLIYSNMNVTMSEIKNYIQY